MGGLPTEGRWCINPITDKLGTGWVSLSDALRDRHPALRQAVDHGAGDAGFGFLRRDLPSPQRGTNQSLIAEHRCFHERSLPVADRLLPSPPPFLLNHLEMPVAEARHCLRHRARDSRHARWNDRVLIVFSGREVKL